MAEIPPLNLPEDQLLKLKRRLNQVAYRQMGDVAEDLVQETLFYFFENIHQGKYRGGSTYPEYFCYALGILKVIIIKEIKKKQQHRSLIHAESPAEMEEKLIFAGGQSSEGDILRSEEEGRSRELTARARALFEEFPPHLQQMIYFHVVENWSYTRLSQHFGIPKQTLVSRFNSAMEKLRRKMNIHHTKPLLEYFHYRNESDVKK
jgi:RNA polymerase sigma factor (sigma-70 family)